MLRRPLLVAFLLGCAVSLMASGRLSLRLVGPATVYASFIPLVEIGGLAAVWRRGQETLPFARGVDLFFRGHGAWLVWLTGFAALWAFIAPARMYGWMSARWIWFGSALAVGLWSAWLDYGYFRATLHRGRTSALRDLLTQRALSWGVGLALFVGCAGWQTVAARMGW